MPLLNISGGGLEVGQEVNRVQRSLIEGNQPNIDTVNEAMFLYAISTGMRTHTRTHAHTHARTRAHTHNHTHTHAHAHTHIRTHTHTHTYTHTHTHTYTHTYTHTNTHKVHYRQIQSTHIFTKYTDIYKLHKK